MRGKNIMLLPMVFVILSAMIVNIGTSQTPTALIYVDPAVLPEVGVGHPGDSYVVSVNVADATDLMTVRFKVQIAKYASVLAISEVKGGDFFGPYPFMLYAIDVFHGVLDIGVSGFTGASGSGTLATFKLTVLEAGNSPVELSYVEMYDSLGDPITTFDVQSGYYYGLTANLWWFSFGGWFSWFPRVGTDQKFRSWVRNNGDLPLDVKVEFTATRFWPGEETVKFGDGMKGKMTGEITTEYYYVNSFTEDYVEWTPVGTSPYLDAPDDGNYIEGTSDAAFMAWFEFEDIDPAKIPYINKVVLEGYTDGPYNEGIDFDVYSPTFGWLGSLYSTGSPEWVSPRWVDPDETVDVLYPDILTETGFNDFAVLLYFYDPDLVGGAGYIVDSLRLAVELAPVTPTAPMVFSVGPGEVLELEPAIWELLPQDKGFWVVTATCYYTYSGSYWHAGTRVMTRYFFVWNWPWW